MPALIADFPTRDQPTYNARSSLLGRQWPLCWTVGNIFFRPMSTLSTIAYAYLSFPALRDLDVDWRLFAVAFALSAGTIVHSAVNMQPLNDRLAALAEVEKQAKTSFARKEDTVDLACRWARLNLVRVVFPLIGGSLVLSQIAL